LTLLILMNVIADTKKSLPNFKWWIANWISSSAQFWRSSLTYVVPSQILWNGVVQMCCETAVIKRLYYIWSDFEPAFFHSSYGSTFFYCSSNTWRSRKGLWSSFCVCVLCFEKGLFKYFYHVDIIITFLYAAEFYH